MNKWILLFMSLALSLLLAACNSGDDTQSDAPDTGDENTSQEQQANTDEAEESGSNDMAAVELRTSEGNAAGSAELMEQEDGVLIHLQAEGIPEGDHGFHIHEAGLCEEPDFESAGSHFNPDDVSHGTESEDGPHAGDLPNVTADEDGTVDEEVTAEGVTLNTGEDMSLLDGDGTALVIHEKPDDNESQPSGDAGSRIACGVIE
ncbi:superoxide dismutase family protein [Halobacillus campisalis]|uniref:Superoxide dismutase [Cu-Zn] n=1 Tax=Halobacillus campisalis TaxID=435909 RepID=A0ABW2K9B8_9BACI|nr:superoxide dismutase family protein [Halobacillus campisalis]